MCSNKQLIDRLFTFFQVQNLHLRSVRNGKLCIEWKSDYVKIYYVKLILKELGSILTFLKYIVDGNPSKENGKFLKFCTKNIANVPLLFASKLDILSSLKTTKSSNRMALKIDEVMDLSLDDYIAISKKSASNGVNANNNNNISNGSNDAKFGRRKGNIDDEEEDEDDLLFLQEAKLEELEEEDTGIWKGPDSSTTYLDCMDTHNDLREKLNSSSSNNNHNQSKHGQLTSVQYRLMAPNNEANRPRGIPTLLPLDAYIRPMSNNGSQNGHRRNRGYNRGSNNNRCNRGYNNGGNYNNNNFGGNYFGGGGGGNNNGVSVLNGRIQRNRQQDIPSKNLRFGLNRDGNFLNNSMTSQQTTARNMIIETPSQCVNLNASAHLNSSFQMPHNIRSNNNGNQSIPIGNLTPQAQAALNLNTNTNQASTSNSNESLKSLLGFQGNLTGDMMPVFASRLMDFIQNGSQAPIHKPLYDMKIQKDIHEIQNKPLLYKCPGGEVVSSDGSGVNCKIIPRTSGVSLNCRFA